MWKERQNGRTAGDGIPEIRRCWSGDIETLGVFGPAAYAQVYGHLWDEPTAYLRQLRTFSSPAFSELLERDAIRIWVATMGDDILGFLSMSIGVPDPVTGASGGAEVARIYILGPARRLGLGRRLLAVAIEEGLAEGCSYVWLNVMASAEWARRAYEKWGFAETGRMQYGGGVAVGMAEMVVMVKPIAPLTNLRTVV